MTDATTLVLRRRWQAPRTDGGLLDSPRLADAGEVAAHNRDRLLASSVVIDGQPLPELRARARSESLLAGRRFLSELSGGQFASTSPCCCHADFDRRVRDSLWFVAGHQPTLTHAGVWVKNIAAALIAEKHSGIGANLIVDQDVISSRAVAVPVGPVASPRTSTVAFDEPAGARPGEEARISDLDQFRQFGDSVTDIVQREWGFTPLLNEVWPAAVTEARNSGRLTRALSAARIALERRHGLSNAEVELSAVSSTSAFLHFFRHLAIRGAEFRESYNARLAEYRQVNRVRSTAHPVPDLAVDGDAHELPFWLYFEGDLHRRRLFVRRSGDSIELSDGEKTLGAFSAAESAEGSESRIAELRELLCCGVRLRPRALATTLFSRLLLADLFIHGIGGAKYDEMTDALGAEFFGLEMPAYMTLTGSRWLPLGGGFPNAREHWRSAQRAVRDARYNAEKFSEARHGELAREKQRLVAELKELKASRSGGRTGRSARRGVARTLRAVEQQLAALVEHRLPSLLDDQRRAAAKVEANRVLQSREFAAVLHPMDSYADWMSQIRSAID
ncbi:hypothetical protein Pan44_30360 [Caulifigura coniformis]|uniref:Uncharacterized protein n=1 Tax=Caulifigura coniformis TaxID=2527983 RepID=A0A517SFT9_9PLAN|nr:hypothetical protein [Caulifigura coniformis]QDT54995.1 hypothetical protein Pan44_30360 [Caulifigura coniformis]